MELRAYIDGGCDPNPGVGCWAFIIVGPDDEVLHTNFGIDPETTNNRMEFEALINVLKHIELFLIHSLAQGRPALSLKSSAANSLESNSIPNI